MIKKIIILFLAFISLNCESQMILNHTTLQRPWDHPADIGNLINETWTNLDFWNTANANSGTFTINGDGTLTVSNGNSDQLRRITNNLYPNMLDKWKITTRFKVVTEGVGLGISFVQEPYIATNRTMICRILASGGNVTPVLQSCVDGSATFSNRKVGTAMAYTVNSDWITVEFQRSFMTYTITLTNETTLATTSFTYTIKTDDASVLIANRHGFYGIHILGGEYIVGAYTVTSQAKQNATVLWLGDSNSVGYNFVDYTDRVPNQVFDGTGVVYEVNAGAGATTTNSGFVGYDPQEVSIIRRIRAKYVIINLLQNDIRFGRTETDRRASYTNIINAVKWYRGTPIILSLYPCTDVDVTGENTWLQSAFPDLQYIDVYSTLVGVGTTMNTAYDQADGIHLNESGALAAAAKIATDLSGVILP